MAVGAGGRASVSSRVTANQTVMEGDTCSRKWQASQKYRACTWVVVISLAAGLFAVNAGIHLGDSSFIQDTFCQQNYQHKKIKNELDSTHPSHNNTCDSQLVVNYSQQDLKQRLLTVTGLRTVFDSCLFLAGPPALVGLYRTNKRLIWPWLATAACWGVMLIAEAIVLGDLIPASWYVGFPLGIMAGALFPSLDVFHFTWKAIYGKRPGRAQYFGDEEAVELRPATSV